jgi:hypothetical protein
VVVLTGLLMIMMAIFVVPLLFLGPLLAPIGVLLTVVFGAASLVVTILVAGIQGRPKYQRKLF